MTAGRLTTLLAAAIVALALALAGCGTSTLSARALRSRASVVCAAAVRRSNRIPLPGSNTGGASFLERGITVFARELDALKKLAPPPLLANPYRAALGDSRQQLDALIATVHDLHSGGDPVIVIKQLDVELAAINARDRVAWRAVGVPVCANQAVGRRD
jgi:hypothetical protein